MAAAPVLGHAARPGAGSVAALVLATAVLYLARDVLLPLALAILFSFLLAPAVRRLERWGLWRIPATLAVVILAFSVVGAVLWVAADQAISLGAKLPEYRSNIVEKIRALRAPGTGDLGKAAEAIRELENEAAPERPPVPVKETPATPLEAFAAWVEPVAKPVATALAVVVFTILMLLSRENLRDRLIVLLGPGRIDLTTRAIGEASQRVSRYLFMQLVVNLLFGIPFGVALYFIGVPNAMLFGLLGVVLRFIPYAGVWIAAALPAALAFAISDGWSMVAWTLGVFFLLELVLVNAVEPWLYGRSAGLSPVAIILAAIFWTWLWGPVGLLLATPLTVCVAVMGRYIPELGYLNVLLGVEPVLAPEERFYQRLVALDYEEAIELAEKHADAHGVAATFESVVMPAVALAEADRAKRGLEPARERFLYESVRRVVEELGGRREAKPAARAPEVCVAAAHDDGDHVGAMVLAETVAGEFSPTLVAHPLLAAEVAEEIGKRGARLACVSALPPDAAGQGAALVKRLRARLPDLRIVVVLWGPAASERSRERLLRAGADRVASGLEEAVRQLRDLAATLAAEGGSDANGKDQGARDGDGPAR